MKLLWIVLLLPTLLFGQEWDKRDSIIVAWDEYVVPLGHMPATAFKLFMSVGDSIGIDSTLAFHILPSDTEFVVRGLKLWNLEDSTKVYFVMQAVNRNVFPASFGPFSNWAEFIYPAAIPEPPDPPVPPDSVNVPPRPGEN